LEKDDAKRIIRTQRKVRTHIGGKTYLGTVTAQYGNTDQFRFSGTEIEKGQEEITARVRAFDLQLPY
jgi:hypothetical protein